MRKLSIILCVLLTLAACQTTTAPTGTVVSIITPSAIQSAYQTYQAAIIAAYESGAIKNSSTYVKWQTDGAQLALALSAYNNAVAAGSGNVAALDAAVTSAFTSYFFDTIGLMGNRPLPVVPGVPTVLPTPATSPV
jgi:hypothetical protein